MIPMKVEGMDGIAVRDNLWGTFWIVRGGQHLPEADRSQSYAVYVKRYIVPDGSPARFKKLLEPEVKLFLCGSYERAETVMKFEATRYKQYRMITYRGEDF